MKRQIKEDKLEKQKKIFLQIGLVIALAIILAAFEWKTYDYSSKDYTRTNYGFIDDELPIITKYKEPTPPPPKVKPLSVIKEVDNDRAVDDNNIFNPEIDQADPVPEFVYIPPEEPEEGQTVGFVTIAQIMPSFPGGELALMEYLVSNIHFTELAKQVHIQGKVYVSFIVEKDGSISTVSLLRGIGGGLDEIAIRAVEKMPKWSPGKQRGIPVRVSLVVPISFKLQ